MIKCIFSTGYAKGSGAQSELTVSLVRNLLHRVQLMHDKELGLCKILQVVFFYQAICWRWTAGLLQCHIRVIRVTRIATVEFKEDYGTEPSRYCLQTSPVRLRFDKVCEVAKQCGENFLDPGSPESLEPRLRQFATTFGPSINFRAQSIAA